MKIWHHYEKYGFGDSIKWAWNRLLRKFFLKKQIIFFFELSEIDENDYDIPENVEIIIAKKENEVDLKYLKKLIESNTELMGMDAKNMIEERFSSGAWLWLMIMDGILVGYSWTISKDPLRSTFLPYTEKDVHNIGTEFFEEFRYRGLLRILSTYRFVKLKQEGFIRYYTETYEWNKAAIRAIEKDKMQKLGIAKKRKSFGRNIVIWYEMYNKKSF